MTYHYVKKKTCRVAVKIFCGYETDSVAILCLAKKVIDFVRKQNIYIKKQPLKTDKTISNLIRIKPTLIWIVTCHSYYFQKKKKKKKKAKTIKKGKKTKPKPNKSECMLH